MGCKNYFIFQLVIFCILKFKIVILDTDSNQIYGYYISNETRLTLIFIDMNLKMQRITNMLMHLSTRKI